MTTDLRGLWVPLITPFDAADTVDTEALTRLGHDVLDAGATGIVALGTTGEPATLEGAERRLVIETCAEVCRSRQRPLIVGAGTNSTRATVAAVRELADVPAVVAALVVVPYYTRPAEAAVVGHFATVAKASPVPVIIYNVPYRTGRGLGVDAILDIAALPNVVGLKQAVGALDRETLEVLRRRPPGFHVLAGDDAYAAPVTLMGGSGAIAAAAHLCTGHFAALVAAALAAEVAEARRLAASLLPVVDAGFAEPSPAGWKAALHALGRIGSPHVRPPMAASSAAARDRLLAAVAAVAAVEQPAG